VCWISCLGLYFGVFFWSVVRVVFYWDFHLGCLLFVFFGDGCCWIFC